MPTDKYPPLPNGTQFIAGSNRFFINVCGTVTAYTEEDVLAYADSATAMQAERHAQEIAAYELTVSNLREQLEARGVPVAWIRYCSDGSYEGPIMDSRMEDVRKNSGVWTPLYAAPQPETTDGMGIPSSCGKPLCSLVEHHPLCKMHQPQPAAQPDRQPMTEKEISFLLGGFVSNDEFTAAVRAVEAFHGITANEAKKGGA